MDEPYSLWKIPLAWVKFFIGSQTFLTVGSIMSVKWEWERVHQLLQRPLDVAHGADLELAGRTRMMWFQGTMSLINAASVVALCWLLKRRLELAPRNAVASCGSPSQDAPPAE